MHTKRQPSRNDNSVQHGCIAYDGSYLQYKKRPRHIGEDDLLSVLHLSQKEASLKLGVSISSLQRRFREFFPKQKWRHCNNKVADKTSRENLWDSLEKVICQCDSILYHHKVNSASTFINHQSNILWIAQRPAGHSLQHMMQNGTGAHLFLNFSVHGSHTQFFRP
mmetsp:Transcript_10763/g.40283  ORF Transcript_10763/g.40283 Transcript_10763/m.40283 type:complete len:165 (-) Transcript_10763:567-1061(-)